MTQLALELPGITTPAYEPTMTLAERFQLWHRTNPHVADLLERLAEQWFAAGNVKCSAKALTERARWEGGLVTQGDTWKINNSFVAFYARLLVERRPEWSGRFEFRTQRAAA